MSGNKSNSAGPSAFTLFAAENTTPQKRSRIESDTFGQDRLFTPNETSTYSKKSAKQSPDNNKES